MKIDLDQIKKEAIILINAGKPQEEILTFLRQNGCSQGVSMILLPAILNCNLGDAKKIVFYSKTWAEFRNSTELLHEEFEEFINKHPKQFGKISPTE